MRRRYTGLNDTELDRVKDAVGLLVKHEDDGHLKAVLLEVWGRLKDEKVERVASGHFNPDFPVSRVEKVESGVEKVPKSERKSEPRAEKESVLKIKPKGFKRSRNLTN